MPEQEAAPTETVEATTPEATETASEKLKPPPELQAIIDKERQNAKDAEKARKALEKELADLRKQTMTEAEQAIDQARNEGRLQALTEVSGKVAAAEIRAAAAGRLEAEQIDTLLDGLNLARFIGEDGEVDRDKVAAFVEGIAPKQEQTSQVYDLGQGARGGDSTALNGDPLLRDLKSKLGIR